MSRYATSRPVLEPRLVPAFGLSFILVACGGDGGPVSPPPPPPPMQNGADLLVTVDGPGTAVAGQTITFTVTLQNLGPEVAEAAAVVLELRPGLTLGPVSNGGVYDVDRVTWADLDDVESGAETTLTADVEAPAVGPLSVRVTASSATADPRPANNDGSAVAANRRTLLVFDPMRTITGEADGDQFGWLMETLGDVDGDGVDDFVVTAPFAVGGSGRAYVYSGASGTELYRFTGGSGERLGFGVDRAGDVDGDGVPDVILGAPGTGAGMAYVYSGADGSELYAMGGENGGDEFGTAVGRLGDANEDGFDDFLVTAPGHDDGLQNSGRVYGISGRDGTTLFTMNSLAANSAFGSAVGGIGDVDGDGIPDLGVGAPAASGSGRVYVLSGADGTMVYNSIPAGSAGSALGQFWLNSPGDVDGDGIPDIFASDIESSAAGGASGRAYVFSGADGSTIHVIDGEANGDNFGIGRGIPDTNGDGVGDLFIAAWLNDEGGSDAGKAYLISGADGTFLRTITSTTADENFGFDAIGIGDLDGDGIEDLLVSGGISASSPGHVHVIAGVR